jgi:hypothetical protein
VNLKNIAGNDVAIFLFRFELSEGNRIDFVVNEAIAEDKYPDIDAKMKPLVHVCCEKALFEEVFATVRARFNGLK